MPNSLSEVTILIKTFERQDACRRLIASIRDVYPDIKVLVVDDSPSQIIGYAGVHTYYSPIPDIGASKGRNIGVDKILTKYTLILDDDCVFVPVYTDLELAVELIEKSDVDILGLAGVEYNVNFDIKPENDGAIVRYNSIPQTTRQVEGHDAIRLYDMVAQIMLCKTDVLKKYKWDESLKTGEHFAYFYKHLGKIKVGYTDEVGVEHLHVGNPTYDKYRARGVDYVKQFMRKAGIKTRIDLSGEVINA
jgi:glycosyltransferase involved in cell wall biosynthesis